MACTTDGEGSSVDGPASGDPTSSTQASATQADPTPGSTSADDTATGSGGSGTAAESTGSVGPAVPGDCRTLLEQQPGSPDGVYTLHAGGDPEGLAFDAYCDMTTDGGGWTLVGRSAPGDWIDLPFGWQQATGSLADDASPYSLDALSAALEFSELLLGGYTEGKTWGPDLFAVPAPEHFVFVYGRAPHAVNATTVAGSCSPPDGPHHLRHIGWTELDYVFNVSDVSYIDNDGLEPNGWDTDDPDCDGGGNLDGVQGMIMVR
ncbi:MAG: hypothetical protein KDK70_12700 [Myxococcales bacterium]|nr:hypothetical protein [Myxococcales bacterium]